MKVLIVDDERDMRRLIRHTLAPRYDVFEAASGCEAMWLLRREKPDLILLDIGLPRIDGHALLRDFRECDPEISVIMLTADLSIEAARSALQCGAVSYITKPFDPRALLGEVGRIAENLSARNGVHAALPWRTVGGAAGAAPR